MKAPMHPHRDKDTLSDPHRLSRFVEAQSAVYEQVRAELSSGNKRSHWMWFVFPQLGNLGRSWAARYFGIGSMAEARAYAEHPVLGPRLIECCSLLMAIENRSASVVLGPPDDLKLRSSMTLFAEAVPENVLFTQVLEKYFDGEPDSITLGLLQRDASR